MTREEAELISKGDLLYHRSARQAGGREPSRAKVTSIKKWVRDPSRIEIGLKHGLRDTFRIGPADLPNWFRTSAEALHNSDQARAQQARLSTTTAPHGRCARSGRCVEHEQNADVRPCRCPHCGEVFVSNRGRSFVWVLDDAGIERHESDCAKRRDDH